MKRNKFWYENTTTLIILTILFWPIGLYGFYKKRKLPQILGRMKNKEEEEKSNRENIIQEEFKKLKTKENDAKKAEKKDKQRLTELYGNDHADKIIELKRENLVLQDSNYGQWLGGQPWLGMTKKMLDECNMNPGTTKKTILKNIVRDYYFYNGYTTKQKKKRYRFRVDLENDVVVGWRDVD